ncbi:MAG: TMEM175 family protein [Ginsengibacter sp.]
MNTGRLEAFSDGVLAIIITIMVLEMKVPHDDELKSLFPLGPVLISYILSFIYIGIYWNNHHHMMQTVDLVNGKVLWANIHLLFWLSLVPFVSGWMGENNFTKWPVILYGMVLLMAAVAYYFLARALINLHGKNSMIGKAFGKDRKGIRSILLYLLGIGFSFINPWIGFAVYAVVAAIWFIPDKRIEEKVKEENLEK